MILDYNMTKDYRSHWSAIDAIREIVQNAIDTGEDFACDAVNGLITVNSYHSVIPMEAFSLGVSIKGTDAIGKYGEGLKIAMLILAREGLEPQVMTGNHIITGFYRPNLITNVKTFCLNFEELDEHYDSVLFSCKVGNIDLGELTYKITPLSKQYLGCPEVCERLTQRKGDIYVSGLWVCYDKELTYGYNFNPAHIDLNTDRNMVNSTTWKLAKYYAEISEDFEDVYDMIVADDRDVADLSYHLNPGSEIMEYIANRFYEDNGEEATIIPPNHTQSYGAVSCSYSAHRVFSKAGIRTAEPAPDLTAPHMVLTQFLEDNKRLFRRDLRISYQALIRTAKTWRKHDVL